MKTGTALLGLAVILGAGAALLLRPGPGAQQTRDASVAVAPSADHGPEPTIGGYAGGQVVANANFWAEDATTSPERLAYSVSTSNLRNVATEPRIVEESSVRDGRRYVSVALDFPDGAVSDDSSIDLTVTFTNTVGRSTSSTMTIDMN